MMKNEDDRKNLIKLNLHKQFIDVGDRKFVYNQIKRLVEFGMKANEHLFLEEPTKCVLYCTVEPLLSERYFRFNSCIRTSILNA